MMVEYFKKKIGEKITHSITTGKTFFTEVYKRTYKIEVLAVSRGTLHVEVRSYNVTPSGLVEGGKDEYFGEIQVKVGTKSKEEIVFEIIKKADPNFIARYNIKSLKGESA